MNVRLSSYSENPRDYLTYPQQSYVNYKSQKVTSYFFANLTQCKSRDVVKHELRVASYELKA